MSNHHPAIALAASKFDICPDLIDEYQAAFDKCKDWFRASNFGAGDEYTLCRRLHDLGLLDKRLSCIIRTGAFRGYRVEFKQPEMIDNFVSAEQPEAKEP
jgi:hypothetical protein